MADLLSARQSVVNIRMSAQEKKELDEIAKLRGMTIAGLVRAWIKEGGASSGNGRVDDPASLGAGMLNPPPGPIVEHHPRCPCVKCAEKRKRWQR
jgi:hypothetical protein